MQPRFIFDCDPGADDALALMLAVRGGLDIAMVTTAPGNAPTAVCAQNALDVLALCGRRDIPVHAGPSQPLARPLAFSGAYSGANGLCNIALPRATRRVEATTAPAAIIAVCMVGPVYILSTAPFTNLAIALRTQPGIAQNICAVVTTCGNYSPAGQPQSRCEWNIAVDPQAAQLVFAAGVPVFAVGLELSAQLTNTMANRLLAFGTKTGGFSHRFFQQAVDFNQQAGLEAFSLLVDALAPAVALAPHLALETQTGHAALAFGAAMPPPPDCMYLIPGAGAVTAVSRFDFEGYLSLLERFLFT